MQFSVQPADDSFTLLLEAGQYQRLWDAYGNKIMTAFKDVTGLEFQQETIDAVVYNDEFNNAGTADEPMHLSGKFYNEREKKSTLTHELGHRLLSGNALSPVGLGIIPDEFEPHPHYQEYDHKHLYLFLFDVIDHAFGKELADWALTDEIKRSSTGDQSHALALHWVQQLSEAKRRRAVQKLIAEALPRARWHERDGATIPAREPAQWYEQLRSSA